MLRVPRTSQDGVPLKQVTATDLAKALAQTGQPAIIAEAAAQMIEDVYGSNGLSHRQLASYIRYGRHPKRSSKVKTKKHATRSQVTLDTNMVALYEQGALQLSISPRVRMKAPQSKFLPPLPLSRSKLKLRPVPQVVEAAYFPSDAAHSSLQRDALAPAVAPTAGPAATSVHLPKASVSAPVLPTVSQGRRLPRMTNCDTHAHQSHSRTATVEPAGSESLFSAGHSSGKAVSSDAKARTVSVGLNASADSGTGSRDRQSRFGKTSRVASMCEEAKAIVENLRRELRESKSKVSMLLAQLDLDGDGQLDRSELRIGFRSLIGADVTNEVLEDVLDVFDADGSGTVDAHELRRAIFGHQKLIAKTMRTGGAGTFKVNANNRNELRQGIESPTAMGAKLTSMPDLPSDNELREAVRKVLSTHVVRVIAAFGESSDLPIYRQNFFAGLAPILGMQTKHVGATASAALRHASEELFDEWDIAGLGELNQVELMKILRKGGRHLPLSRRKRDPIFQAEILKAVPKEQRTKETAASLARQALHGFMIQTKDEQLQARAEKVAPVQLEALMQAMSNEVGTVLDLFLRWDTDGDGTVCAEEFAAAIVALGFDFSKEVCDELFAFFDRDDSDAVNLEEIEATLKWGKSRKANMRPLLAGWRQLALDMSHTPDETSLEEKIRAKLVDTGHLPSDLFKHWDDDGNGTLDKSELADLVFMLGGMKVSNAEADNLFATFDKDNSGAITFKELNRRLREDLPVEKLMRTLSRPDMCDRLFELFQRWDKDGDGVLDMDEFRLAMKDIGVHFTEEAFRDLFQMLDEDDSGSISLKEIEHTLRWIRSCEACQQLRAQAFTFDGTLTIQEQIRRALAANSVRVLVRP